MFEFIRTHKGLMQIFLLVLIVPSFAFVGIGSYSSFRESPDTVAKVAGKPISKREWEAAQLDQLERYRQMFGAQFDSAMFETPKAKMAVLENLIAQRSLAAAAQRDHLTVSDHALQQTILQIPGLLTPDGKFDVDRYKSLLALQGMTPEIFQNRLRGDLVLQQIQSAVSGSYFAPQSVLNNLLDIAAQERDVQLLAFKAVDFTAQTKISDDMIKTYYEQNKKQFEIPEKVSVQYVVLDNAAAAAQVKVSDADIEAYYQKNKDHFSQPELRRASHILIAVPKDASAAVKAADKAKAEAILAKLRKDPAQFAALAKEDSQDPGSAQNGGDLGYFDRKAMVDSFSNTVFSMKQGEISNLVESPFGYHIIELTGIKPAQVKPLSEVKAEISSQLKARQISDTFAKMADSLKDIVFENGDTLQPVVDKLHLTVQTADNLTRIVNPTLPQGTPYNNEKFLNAIFSDDAIKGKHNTEAIEVAPNVLIAGRVLTHQSASTRPFAQVESGIRQILTLQESVKLADQAGEKKLAALKATDNTQDFSAVKSISRTNPNGLNAQELLAVMQADTSKLPTYVGVAVAGQGYRIYRISKVHQPAQPDAAKRKSEVEQLTTLMGQQEMTAYVAGLKKEAKAEIVGHPLLNTDGDGQ